MSASHSNLDSPTALAAFQNAMAFSRSPMSARPAQPSEASEKAPSVEPSVKSQPEENLSNEDGMTTTSESRVSSKTVTSSVIKCLNCGEEMILTTNPGKASPIKDSPNDGNDGALAPPGLSMPSEQGEKVSSSKAKTANVDMGMTNVATAAASMPKSTDSTTTPVLRDTRETTPASHPGTPVHHLALADLVSNNVATPVHRGVQVPQNSPANVPSGPARAASEKPEDHFTREEAHDVVIDIFKELAALGQRSKSNSPTQSKPSQGRGLAPLSNASSSEANENAAQAHDNPSKSGQTGLFTTPKGSANTSPQKFPATNENLSPHMGIKGRNILVPKSRIAPTEDDPVPPHLRTAKHKLGQTSPSKASTNFYSVLDPSYKTAASGKMEEAEVKEGSKSRVAAERRAKPPGLSSVSSSSSESSFESMANWEGDKDEEKADRATEGGSSHQDAAVNKAVVLPLSSSAHAKSRTKDAAKGQAKSSLQSEVPSWLVNKYASKKPSTLSKTVASAQSPIEDLEHQTLFSAWPGQEERSRPVAGIRTCHIKQIPSLATPEFVCSLVFGGALEYIRINSDAESSTATAIVRFLSIEDCKRFYDETANGVPFKYGPQSMKMTAWVTLGKEVDVIGGLLAQHIDQGVTRCLRAVPVDANLKKRDLVELAVDKGRQLEGFTDGESRSGSRSVTWRFTDIAHAVAFRGVLARNADFESCNVSYSEDPCALRDGVEDF